MRQLTWMTAVLALLAVGATEARAQWRGPRPAMHLRPADAPALEVGLATGLWNLNGLGGGDLAVRVTRHWAELVGLEVGLHGGRAQGNLPRYALLEATARVTLPHPNGRGAGYVRVGLAGGSGLTYRLSPAVAAGYEAWGPQRRVAARVEVLVLRDGQTLRDRGLFTVGVSVRVR